VTLRPGSRLPAQGPQLDPGADGPFEVTALLFHFLQVGEPHVPNGAPSSFEGGVLPGKGGALVEHQVHVALRPRIDARDVAIELAAFDVRRFVVRCQLQSIDYLSDCLID